MKVLIVSLVIVIALGLLGVGRFISSRDDLTSQKEGISEAWVDVDGNLRQRVDLIPDLMRSLKSYVPEDPTVADAIAASRAAMLKAQTREQKIDAFNQLNAALGRLLVLAEIHPHLKENQSLKSAEFQLEGNEDRILQARRRYNDAIKRYNKTLTLFPNNIVAGLSGFSRDDAYFKTGVNAGNPPPGLY